MCLYATSSPLLAAFSNGSLSKYVSSPSIKLKKPGSITKNPPFIQPSFKYDFSLKLTTWSPFNSIAPNELVDVQHLQLQVFHDFYEMLKEYLN